MKRVVKMNVAYLESIMESLRYLNGWSEEQVKDFCGKTKTEALENVIRGLESTVNRATGRDKEIEAAINTCYDVYANGGV